MAALGLFFWSCKQLSIDKVCLKEGLLSTQAGELFLQLCMLFEVFFFLFGKLCSLAVTEKLILVLVYHLLSLSIKLLNTSMDNWHLLALT